jgi:hypothetical protein
LNVVGTIPLGIGTESCLTGTVRQDRAV